MTAKRSIPAPGTLTASALPVQAKTYAFECQMLRNCSALLRDCTDVGEPRRDEIDLDASEGRIFYADADAPVVGHAHDDGIDLHMIMTNDLATEFISFRPKGGIAHTGHLSRQDRFSIYRVEGDCEPVAP
jgi:hypothetical protein